MSATVHAPELAEDWCLRFVQRRCREFAWAALADGGENASAQVVAGPAFLSLAEIDLQAEARGMVEYDHLAVLALQLRQEAGAPRDRVILRFVTPAVMRSASHVRGARVLVNDIGIGSPPGLDEVSLLVYRVRRTQANADVLAALESLVEGIEGAEDECHYLARAALEHLEVLDESADAEITLSGSGLRFDRPLVGPEPALERYLAVVRVLPGGPPMDRLWLAAHQLLEGPARDSARAIDGRPYALVRLGVRSTRQSVSEFIKEIRRRHQRAPDEDRAAGESFSSFVGRQMDQRKRELIQAMFGHHKMLPVVTPIALEVAANLEQTVQLTEAPAARFKLLIEEMRSSIRTKLGVQIPGLRIRLNEGDLPSGSYIIMLDEIPLVMGTVDPRQLLCFADVPALAQASPIPEWDAAREAREARVPDGSDRSARWIPIERGDDMRKAGLEVWDAGAYIQAHLQAVLVANLDLFVTVDGLGGLFGSDDDSIALYDRIAVARGGMPRFVEVLRSLTMEALPITPLEPLAQRYLGVVDGLTWEIAEELRGVPVVQTHLTRGVPVSWLGELDEKIEEQLWQAIRFEGEAAVLALKPEPTQEILSAVRSEVSSIEKGSRQVLAIRNWRLRPFVRSLLVLEFPQLRVVAWREIENLPDLPKVAARISILP